MTTITPGMTPAQFITAMNDNVTSLSFVGRSVTFDSGQLGHEIQTALKLNSFGSLNYGISGQAFINTCNALSKTDSTIAPDVKTFGATGDGVTDDTTFIQAAVSAGSCIIQSGTFRITASIKIPSNRIVYLKNCILRMGNAAYDNFFCNADLVNGNSNIKIIGIGNVEFDGNAANRNDGYAAYGGSIVVSSNPALINPNFYKYNALIFCKVDDFEISGLYIYNNPHWGFHIQKCSNGIIHDICINDSVTVECQDLINNAHSHDIEVYNITALDCPDDLTAFGSNDVMALSYLFCANPNKGDIFNINMHDIRLYYTGYHFTVFIGGDAQNQYDIIIKNVKIDYCQNLCYTGLAGFYDVRPTKEEIKNITMDNIQIDVASGASLIDFWESCSHIVITNFRNNTGKTDYSITAGRDVTDNVTINGVQVT